MTKGLDRYLYVFYAGLHSISSSARLAAAVSMIVLIGNFPFSQFSILRSGNPRTRNEREGYIIWSVVVFFLRKIYQSKLY